MPTRNELSAFDTRLRLKAATIPTPRSTTARRMARAGFGMDGVLRRTTSLPFAVKRTTDQGRLLQSDEPPNGAKEGSLQILDQQSDGEGLLRRARWFLDLP
jgi:hypothetical protein